MKQSYNDFNIDYADEVLKILDKNDFIIEACSLEGLVRDELDKKKIPFDDIVLDPINHSAIVYYKNEEACDPFDIIELCENYVETNFKWDGKSEEEYVFGNNKNT